MTDLYSRQCQFWLVPDDTLVLSTGLTFLPQQGMIVEFLDHDTSTTTRYRVQDVILQFEENIAVPAGEDGIPPASVIERLVEAWRVEVAVLP